MHLSHDRFNHEKSPVIVKGILKACGSLLHFFLVSSLPSMTDRLESIARQNM